MTFTKRQKMILMRAYRQSKWTLWLHDNIVNEDVHTLNEKLRAIGYGLHIKFVSMKRRNVK